jgi:hypothetical protein
MVVLSTPDSKFPEDRVHVSSLKVITNIFMSNRISVDMINDIQLMVVKLMCYLKVIQLTIVWHIF